MEKPPMTFDNLPSAPPAYDDEFRPPPYCPTQPYPPQTVPLQTAAAPYPQQQYAMPVPQMSGEVPSAVIVQNTESTVIPLQAAVGPTQVTTTCPMCRKIIRTSTERTTKWTAHAACLFLCLLQCWCCWCIPYWMDSCYSVHHTCPHCKYFIGTYNK